MRYQVITTIYGIKVTIQIIYTDKIVFDYQIKDYQTIDLSSGMFPQNVWRIMKGMKEQERCSCRITDSAFRNNENSTILENLLKNVDNDQA